MKTGQLLIASLGMLISGCLLEDQKAVVADNLGPGVSFTAFDVNAFPLNRLVCEPFGSTATTSTPLNGIRTKLFYRMAGMPRYYTAQQYVDLTQASGKDIFLSQVNVPTRMFDTGFSSQTNDVLKNDSGQTLIEYFGLKMSTAVRLSENDPEGAYEFALLSDDGSVMKIKNPDETWSVHINNDGDHPTRMGCASNVVNMTRRTRLEVDLTYYQGPRYHISNVLMWRPVPAGSNAGSDSECGKSGNNYFFDPNNGSVSLPPYAGLIARGWKVLAPNNFWVVGADLKQTTNYNPCTVGVNPVISQFTLGEALVTDVFVSWVTDIPATDQVMITNVSTGASTLTVSDNILRTQHQVRVSGLTTQTTYTLKAVSISDTLGKAISDPLTLTTP